MYTLYKNSIVNYIMKAQYIIVATLQAMDHL